MYDRNHYFGLGFGSDTDTDIGPWFRFLIQKPGFGCTLSVILTTYQERISFFIPYLTVAKPISQMHCLEFAKFQFS